MNEFFDSTQQLAAIIVVGAAIATTMVLGIFMAFNLFKSSKEDLKPFDNE